ncbi:MAG: OsmC family peroxiredoxin [Flavobacteriaceae bacterium]|nr:OsmC family peroxiredoxin [Flavobacteriaceae bacterium]
MKRRVHVIWKGDGADGTGHMSTQSKAINQMPYSFKSRFENEDGALGTNPEELIVSALAGCFNMKLAFVLNENNYHPKELDTKAVLTFEEGVITKIEMELKASLPDINQDEFNALAEEAKQNCPISGVLKCDILLEASLV